MADFGKYSPPYTLRSKKLGEGRGDGESAWKLRIENGVFATANSQLLIMEMNFALSDFEIKVFTLEINFQFRIVTFGKLSSHI